MARKGRDSAVGSAEGGAKRTRRRASASGEAAGTRSAEAPVATTATGERPGFYADVFTPEERSSLIRAAGAVRDGLSLESEIDLLRIAIRRGVADGESLEAISRSVQRLAQTLKVERELRGQGLRELEEALARALDEIGAELGNEEKT